MSDLPAPSDQTLSQWDRFLRDPAIDVEKLKALFELHERAEARTAKAAFNAAFAAMQGELPTIDETGAAVMNGQRRYSYAPQEEIVEIVKPILQKYGFALRFRHEYHDGLIRIIGILSHRDGHQEQDEFECPADTSGSKNAIQAVGSTRTYGQRYTTRALLNIVSRDPRDPARDTDGHRSNAIEARVVYEKPSGYDAFKAKLEATVPQGYDALRAVWMAATEAQRNAMPEADRTRLKAAAHAADRARRAQSEATA